MARLTVGMMEQIAHAVCRHRYKAQEDALKAQREAAGRRLYDELFPPALLAKVAKAPDEFIYHSDTFRVAYGRDGKLTYHVSFGEARPLPARFAHYQSQDVKHPHPVMEEIVRANDASKQLREVRAAAYKEIMGVLRGFRTTKALRAGWPEIVSFIPEEAPPRPDRPLQRVPAELNTKLKLPPGAQKPAAKKAAKKRAKT